MAHREFNGGGGPRRDLESAQDGGGFALSSAQLGIWFAQKLDPSSPAYNIGEYIELNGPIDPALFERALRQAVFEAETLRVRFVDDAAAPRQIVGAPAPWSLCVIDVSAEDDARAAAETWMKADLARPVEPTIGPLFGFALFKASAGRFFWYARYHHLVMDGYGMWLVARRVAEAYSELCAGRAAPDAAFGSLSELVELDAAYRASDRVRTRPGLLARGYGRASGAWQPQRERALRGPLAWLSPQHRVAGSFER